MSETTPSPEAMQYVEVAQIIDAEFRQLRESRDGLVEENAALREMLKRSTANWMYHDDDDQTLWTDEEIDAALQSAKAGDA
jgi:hypothetical protein